MSGFGAGQGADMLQAVLQRKFQETIAQQKLAEDIRQANLQSEAQKGNLALGNRRTDEEMRQFDAQAPLRTANVAHIGAETDSLNRAPVEADKSRTFSAGEAEKGRAFTGGQGDLNRGNAVRIAGINGQNALRVANVRHPDTAGASQSQKEANEVEDTLSLIDEIEKDGSLSHAVGPVDQYAGGIINADPAGVNRFKALHDQLVGKLSLAQAGKLKGQGQISDKERAMLGAAATALNRGLNEADYKVQLQKVRDQFARMPRAGGGPAPAAGGGGQEFDYVPGKGLVPRK